MNLETTESKVKNSCFRRLKGGCVSAAINYRPRILDGRRFNSCSAAARYCVFELNMDLHDVAKLLKITYSTAYTATRGLDKVEVRRKGQRIRELIKTGLSPRTIAFRTDTTLKDVYKMLKEFQGEAAA